MSNIISGSCGAAGAGATVVLSGTASASTTAAAGTGNYSFSALGPGPYLVTPGLAGKEFSPTNAVAVIVASDITGVNFTAFTPIPALSFPEIVISGAALQPVMQSPRTSLIGTNLRTKTTN